eukprot:TRINITY_DN1736_c0_g1_i2.p1 TRINITY_DN1736_c0_g1~~TRINITY_DN1736_c0_g1_i2.p1  ORF type:complete len:390 (+),score=83.36 TRINITY_DN1736_c0_g1_i2:28-1197(+)
MSEEPVNQPPVSLAFPSFPSFPLTPCSPQNAFNDLPAEVAANIFSFLPLGERLRGRTVCKHWDQLMELPECWAFLDLKPYKSKITNQLLMSWQDKYCRVESLDIRGCHRLDSATISFVLANSPGLRKFVGVGLATIMVSALSVLAESCPNLTHLDLSCCSNVTGSGLSILAKGCPNLEYLGLRGFSTSQRFSHFTKADIPLLKLKHLDISSSQIGLLDLKHMKTENFPELGRLDMFFCSSVANMAVDYISQNFINLWYLDISMCLNVSDDGLTSIATSPLASTLQYLDIGGCNRVTERGIEVMALCCSQLRWLYIDDNNNVNDDCLQAIGGNMKHLKRVDFTHDTKVSDVGVAALAQGCPNLRYLTLTETQATLEGCQQMFGEGVKIKF